MPAGRCRRADEGVCQNSFPVVISPCKLGRADRARRSPRNCSIQVITVTIIASRPRFFFSLFGKRSEEHTSELQSLMLISYAVFCLKKKTNKKQRQKHKHYNHTNVDE